MAGRTADGNREHGQASLEYVAVVLVVAAVLAVAGVTGSGATIVNAVHAGIRRAICVAGGETCAPFHVPEPCLVRRTEQSSSSGVSFLVVRIGGTERLVVERRSDGSARVTAYRDVAGGVGLSVGAHFGLGRAGTSDETLVPAAGTASGLTATAELEARLRGGWGTSWDLPDAASTAAFLREYRAARLATLPGRGGDAPPKIRAPDVERVRVGVDGQVTGEITGPLGVDLRATAFVGLHGEGTRDRRTGETTVTVGVPGAIAADLAGPLNRQVGGGLRVAPAATVTLDRDLRPRELRLVGRVALRDGSRIREVQLRVDLTRPAVREHLGDLLAGLRDRRAEQAVGAATALGRWAAREGWIDERVYGTTTEAHGHAGELALGLRLGFHDEDRHHEQTLLAARTRPPGGVWETRTACLAPAAAAA